MSWYFNIISRIERFNLIPLDADMVERQALAMRRFRFRLLDHEPLPPGAWTIYICVCCRRIATFSDSPMYGNFGVSYDHERRTYVCSKKASRAARVRQKPVEVASLLETDLEKAKTEASTRQKKSRADRKEDNLLTCEGQPVIPVNLYGVALEFDGDRFLICPNCGQFHTYRDTGWGRDGYRCKNCRDAETPLAKTLHCAHCSGTNELRPVTLSLFLLSVSRCLSVSVYLSLMQRESSHLLCVRQGRHCDHVQGSDGPQALVAGRPHLGLPDAHVLPKVRQLHRPLCQAPQRPLPRVYAQGISLSLVERDAHPR